MFVVLVFFKLHRIMKDKEIDTSSSSDNFEISENTFASLEMLKLSAHIDYVQTYLNEVGSSVFRIETIEFLKNKSEEITNETFKRWIASNISSKDSENSIRLMLNECILRPIYYALLLGELSILEEQVPIAIEEIVATTNITSDELIELLVMCEEVIIYSLQDEMQPEVLPYLDRFVSILKANAPSLKHLKMLKTEHSASTTESVTRNNSQEIKAKGDRVIAYASGAAFLGGLIAQIPGAIAGALAGTLFGLLSKDRTAKPSANS
jgi:hypothetical protein